MFLKGFWKKNIVSKDGFLNISGTLAYTLGLSAFVVFFVPDLTTAFQKWSVRILAQELVYELNDYRNLSLLTGTQYKVELNEDSQKIQYFVKKNNQWELNQFKNLNQSYLINYENWPSMVIVFDEGKPYAIDTSEDMEGSTFSLSTPLSFQVDPSNANIQVRIYPNTGLAFIE